MNWRTVARKHVDLALAEGRAGGLEGKALEKFVRDHYPFGERAMHPYKVWLSEVRKSFPAKPNPGPAFEGEHPFLLMPGTRSKP
jgi:hypothetical protein